MNPFDYVAQDDPEENSPHSKDPGAEETGESSEGRDATSDQQASTETNDRIAALERKLRESGDREIDMAAQMAAIRGEKKSEQEGEKELTHAEYKKFGLEDDGKQQIDASIHYTDSVVKGLREEIKTEIRSEYRQEKTREFIQEYMYELYPDFKNPDSEFSKRVLVEQKRLLNNGAVDTTSPDANTQAMSLALHRVGRTYGGQKTGETGDERRTRRRVEESAAEGAPVANGQKDNDQRMSKDERALLTSMLGRKPSKEGAALFTTLKQRYDGMRVP